MERKARKGEALQPKTKGIIISLVTVLVTVIAVLGYLCFILKMNLSDTKFRHGDIYYWLFTDDEIRQFPIIGADRKDAEYVNIVLDGTQNPGMLIRYKSNTRSERLFQKYQVHCQETGYKLAESERINEKYYFLKFKGKSDYFEVTIIIESKKEVSNVEVHFIKKVHYE